MWPPLPSRHYLSKHPDWSVVVVIKNQCLASGRWRQCAPHLYYVLPWIHPSPYSKEHLDRFSRFAHLTAESPYTLQQAALLPLKIAASHWGIWSSGPEDLHLIRGSRGPPMIVIDRQTDRQTTLLRR